jgi:hypothetical protein
MDEASDAHERPAYRRALRCRLGIIGVVTSALSAVPRGKRKQLGTTLALFALLFLAVGAVALAGGGGAAVGAFAAVAILVSAALALTACGVLRSIRIEHREDAATQLDASIDAAITEALAAQGYGSLCNCGHEHDPTELHITDAEPCPNDATGQACAHDCESCLLAAMRPPAPTGEGRPAAQ